jgi:hypothetical protein
MFSLIKLGLHANMHYQWRWNDQKKKGSHLKTLLFSNIYKIQIVQNITQLSSKGDLISRPYF